MSDLHRRELTIDEHLELNKEISEFIDASLRKRKFMDDLMLKTSYIQPGDLIYVLRYDQKTVDVLGVVYGLLRPYAESQQFALDNDPTCRYQYMTPWRNLVQPPSREKRPGTPGGTDVTGRKDHPDFLHRQQVIDMHGEDYVKKLDEEFFREHNWAIEFISRFKKQEETQ